MSASRQALYLSLVTVTAVFLIVGVKFSNALTLHSEDQQPRVSLNADFKTLEPAAGSIGISASERLMESGRIGGKANIQMDFGKMPLYFIENAGHLDKRVGYYVHGQNTSVYFTSEGLTYVLHGRTDSPAVSKKLFHTASLALDSDSDQETKTRRWVVKLDFIGADPNVLPKGVEENQTVVSYFKGPKENWKAGLKTYKKIVYENLWPGIDLVYDGNVNKLKYEFVVKPGADPSRIKLGYRGTESVKINQTGQLEVATPIGNFNDEKPYAYQKVEGERKDVTMAYVLQDVTFDRKQTFGFAVGDYDASKTLILDPAVLIYLGYIGGDSVDEAHAIAIDGQGNAYVTGTTQSLENTFPASVGPDLTFNDSAGASGAFVGDAFVAKVRADGTGLHYVGYIGGDSHDEGNGIAVDTQGNAYIIGSTSSSHTTFPVKGGPSLTHAGGNGDAFVAKITTDGTSLVFCGYIGGSGIDDGRGIAVDLLGNIYVTGETSSTQVTFPVTVGPDLTFNGGGSDAFVGKLRADGSGFLYLGYIGGAISDAGNGIAIDAIGNAYVIGETLSSEASFPVLVGPAVIKGMSSDGFITKVKADGTGLVYSGYIGTGSVDSAIGIAVDAQGNAYVTGIISPFLPTPVTVGPRLTPASTSPQAFVGKVKADGSGFVYLGYIFNGVGNGIAVNSQGNAYVAGKTASEASTGDAFVAKVRADGTDFVYLKTIGGSGNDSARGIAVDAQGNAYVAGLTSSTQATFPVRVGPDLFFNFGQDAFVAKIAGILSQVPFDFDGDGKTDISVYRNGLWIYRPSSGGANVATQFGGGSDVPMLGDYDGDDKNDIAVYRNGLWIILRSSDGVVTATQFGGGSDEPLPADYDGDGKADIAVYRNGLWIILRSSDGVVTATQFGGGSDVPLPADYDGDGKADIAVYRNGLWIYQPSSGGANVAVQFGGGTDVPVPADYDGDGKADVAVYRSGLWIYQPSAGGANVAVQFGGGTDVPVPADYNGDGKTDVAVYRNGLWIYKPSSGGANVAVQFGGGTDVPLN